MFQIKARVDYGLMIMVQLASKQGETTSLSGLAKRMKVSSIYLIQIAKLLAIAGLIGSKEGNGGGYFLAKPASKISVLSIIEALEGPIQIRCHNKMRHDCPNIAQCEVKSIWSEIIFDLKGLLGKKSLASLIKK